MSVRGLKALLEQRNAVQRKKTTVFENIVAVDIGCPPTPYYPKLYDADGKVQKDADGNVKKSKEQSGFLYKFVTLGEKNPRIVSCVYKECLQLELLTPVLIKGEGYSIAQANLIFLVSCDINEISIQFEEREGN